MEEINLIWIKPTYTYSGVERVTNVTHYPGEFVFEDNRDIITKSVKLGEAKLIHATFPEGLAAVLTESSTPTLKTNINNDSNELSSGVLFCGIHVEFDEDEVVNRNAILNRYGVCVIKFQLPEDFFSGRQLSAFIAGTKCYQKEHCQTILIDSLNSISQLTVSEYDTDNRVICEKLQNPADYTWNLHYETDFYFGMYTTAELLFTHQLELLQCRNLTIHFDDQHKCVFNRRRRCWPCVFKRNRNWNNLQVTWYRLQENPEYLGEEFVTRRDNIWNLDQISKSEMAIMLFALSVRSVKGREDIKSLQLREPPVFIPEQFDKILSHWDEYPDEYIKY